MAEITLPNKKPSLKQTWPFHLLLLSGMIILLLYYISPMFMGIIISVQNFIPARGIWNSRFVGMDNYRFMFMLPDTWIIIRNTLMIAVSKMILTLMASIFFAILLHESRFFRFKKIVQTIAYLPFFLSWVILASIFRNILDVNGIVNQLLNGLNILQEPVIFLGNNTTFQPVVILTDVWKVFGYSAIIFVAALAGVNQELYEVAAIDGASRLRRIWHITLPGIRTTIVLVGTLNIPNVLNAGFDQIFNLYSPIVYRTGDIIDTYVYRASFISYQFSLATSVGIIKSSVSFILIAFSYWAARRFANYRIF